MWILGIPLSFVLRDRPEHYGYLPDGEETGGPLPEIGIRNKGLEIGLRQALRMRSFWYLNGFELIRMMTVVAVITHVMPYLSNLAISRSTGGLIAGAIPLFSIIGRFGFGWLGDATDKRYALALSFCLMSIGLMLFCYVQVIWVACVFLLLFSPGYGGGMVVRGAILREYFGRDSFGKILGIIMGCAAVGGIIGPTLAGWVFDILGSYQPIWLIFCGLTGLTALLTLRIG
jgi:MFS family permease